MKTALLIDGEFFLRRVRKVYGGVTAQEAAHFVREHATGHLRRQQRKPGRLYRIFFYDCPPLAKKVHHPISGRSLDFSKTDVFRFRTDLHRELLKLRKVALRRGFIDEKHGSWILRKGALKSLLKKERKFEELTDDDFCFDVRQKGVDMRIGLDIASLSLKQQVDQIILIAGDSDFVPAAKMARREGIDFILDPMFAPIRPDLNEHIDGLQSVCPNPRQSAPEDKTEIQENGTTDRSEN
ncbi:NYN domain-containing protein [Stratiformator vulcanicus]|uniref:NYN domain protein n=1 Tax=Stratiformator vulcanicus TaxID=2527980 RepID=A0A517QW33_9PLAN|nr:NYN domain-containing protein [Stratiformator vulcanicus]QDT35851.1 NYN domain protein [Stratiformator vulcanicus]